MVDARATLRVRVRFRFRPGTLVLLWYCPTQEICSTGVTGAQSTAQGRSGQVVGAAPDDDQGEGDDIYWIGLIGRLGQGLGESYV